MKPVKLILDTDIGGDCDDAGALAMMHALADRGECEILAVTHCCRGRQYGECIEAINRYYGRADIPVGVFADSSTASDGNDVYASAIAERFPSQAAYSDSLTLLRKTLAQAEDGEVTLAVIGSMHTMRRLLESEPDEISSLNGRELIGRKIHSTVVMGGRFHKSWPEPIVFPDGYVVDTEFNIRDDIPSAYLVCREWPGELTMCSYEIGYPIITAQEFQKSARVSNPAAMCYRLWHERTGANGLGRESWDLATVLYAVRPEAEIWKLHPDGRISIDEKGITTWEKAPGRQRYLLENLPHEDVRALIDGLLRERI